MAESKVIDLEVKTNLGSLKSQLREAQAEVAKMSEKFGAASVEASNAAKAAGILKDKIGDAKALTDAFNPDAKFKSVTASISGVAGGFAAYEGAMNLVGVKSQEVEAALLKVQSAMAISQGLQSVGESIDSFKQLGAVIKSTSIFQGIYNFIQTGSFKAAKDTTNAVIEETVATKLQGSAMLGTSTSTGIATVAMKAFRAALITTGIGILVAGLVMAVQYLGSFIGGSEDSEAAQKKLDDALAATNKTLENQKNAYEKLAAASKFANDKQLINALNAGASEKELNAIKLKGAQDNLGILLREYEASKDFLKKTYDNSKRTQAQQDAAFKARDEASKRYAAELINVEMSQAEAKNASIKAAQTKQDEANKKNREANKAHNDKKKADDAKHLADSAKAIEDNRIAIHNSEVGFFEATIASNDKLSKKAFEAQKGLLLENRDFALADLKLTEGQKEAIKAKYNADAIQLQKDHDLAIKEAAQKVDEDIYKSKKGFIEGAISDDAKNLQFKKDLLLVERDFTLLNTELTEGEIFAIKQKYAKDVAELDKEDAAKTRANQKQKLEMAVQAFSVLQDATTLFTAKNDKDARKQFQINKALSLSSAIVNTALAVTGALTAGGNPIKLATGMQFVEAGIAAASGAVSIAKIAGSQYGGFGGAGGGGGGGGGNGGGSTPAAPQSAPNFNLVGATGLNQLDMLGKPIQAFVVGGEVTTYQELERNRLRNATL
jgi:hypothetical protein